LDPYTPNSAKAGAELQAAGMHKQNGKWLLPDGTPWKLTLEVPSSFNDWVAAAKAISSQLADAGIDAQVVTAADYPLYLQQLSAGQYDVAFWLVALGPAPYTIYQRLYGTSNGWQLFGGRLTHAAPGTQGNWMGSPETVDVPGAGRINPGELTVKLNS